MILNVFANEAGKEVNVRQEILSALQETCVKMGNVWTYFQPRKMGESFCLISPKNKVLSSATTDVFLIWMQKDTC